MRGAALAAVLLALLSAGARADDPPAKKKPFKASFIGEGGGYTHPDKATQDYMEGDLGAGAPGSLEPTKASPAADSGARPAPSAPAAAPASSPAPRAPVPAPAAPRPAAPAVSAPARTRAAAPAAETRPASRPSLWNGLVSPLEMNSAAANAADPDAARASGDRDYETHILGLKETAPRPALGAPTAPAPAPSAAPSAAPTEDASRLFVSLEIDPREAGTLRDAVAGLGAAAGFSPDARFEPMVGPGGSQLLSGWMPASRLADALRRPGVRRLRVETRPRPAPARPTSSDFVIGLRVDDPARARDAVDAGAADLAKSAEFKLTRVVGLETAPDGRSVAIVVGRLPLAGLGRALARPEVAKIAPLGAEAASAPAPAAPAGLSGFARFAVRHGLWLILLTLALALPSLRDAARRLAETFVPYR